MTTHTIQYSVRQDPPRQDGQPAGLHVRTHKLEEMNTAALAASVGRREGQLFSESTISGVLTDLSKWLAEYLASGHAVTLTGIGTFTPHVDGEVEDDARGRRVGQLRVSDIHFAPSAELIDSVNGLTSFERVGATRKTNITDTELDAFLAGHFAEHSHLQRHHVERHFNLSKRRALSLISRLVNDGRLRLAPDATLHSAAYVPASNLPTP